MKRTSKGLYGLLIIAVLSLAILAGCGGGGGSSSSGTTTPTTTTATLSGVAAKGAAFASVTVAIKDKNGSTKTGTTGTDGKYSIDITGMTAPFLLKVSDGTTTYYSVSTATGTATANIHQFTDLIIRNWYKVKGADIETDFASSAALSQIPTATEIDTIAAVVRNILSSWLSNIGIDASTFNLITSSFNADGTGFDKVLDNSTVAIDASGNVTVTSNDPTTGTSSTIATTTISTDLTGGTHASGTYTWNSTTGVISTNWTSSNFVCEGPSVSEDTDTETGVTITSTTMTWSGEGDMTWTRSSGTAGDIVGTWTSTDSTTGNSYTLTVNADGTVSVVGVIVSCGSGGGGSGVGGGGTTSTTSITIPAATITVDGNTSDWSGISALASDPQGDSSTSYTGDDIKALYVAKDSTNLYIRMDLWENANTNFGNGPSPNDGDYRVTINSNSSTYPTFIISAAYFYCGQWSLYCNDSGTSVTGGPSLISGPSYVGVSSNVMEFKVPLSVIGNPTAFYSIAGEVNDCCAHAEPPTILDDVLISGDTQNATVYIEGHVLLLYSSGTTTPIQGAAVSTSLDSQTVTTNSTGYFFLQTSTPANYSTTPYTITISATGYQTFNQSWNWGDHPITQTFHLCGVSVLGCTTWFGY